MLIDALQLLTRTVVLGRYAAVTVGLSVTPICLADARRFTLQIAWTSGATCFVGPDVNVSPTIGLVFASPINEVEWNVEQYGGVVQMAWYGIAMGGPVVVTVMEVIVQSGADL